MNNLIDGDYISPDKENRVMILELLERRHIQIECDTWDERNFDGDYENYPSLVWSNTHIVALKASDHRLKNKLTVDEFIHRGGVSTTKWGRSSLKFHFF